MTSLLLFLGCENTGIKSVQLSELDFKPNEGQPGECPYTVKTPPVTLAGFSEPKFYQADAEPKLLRLGYAGPTDSTFVVNWWTPGPRFSEVPKDEEGNPNFEQAELTLATEIIYGTNEDHIRAANSSSNNFNAATSFHTTGHYMVKVGLSTIEGEEVSTFHEVHVCGGLEPNTQYYYKVGGPNHWSEVYSVSTGPSLDQAADHSWTLAVSGDTRGQSQSINEAYWPEINQAILEEYQADLHIFSGDAVVSGNNFEEWKGFFDYQKEGFDFNVKETFSRVPFMMAHGNHEQRNVLYYTLLGQPQVDILEQDPSIPSQYLKESWYSFDYANAHFIILMDDVIAAKHPAIFSKDGAQYKWLEQDLASVDREKTPWIFISTHVPFYTCQTSNSRELESQTMRKSFQDLVDSFHVDIVFSGHNHEYSRTKPIFGLATGASNQAQIDSRANSNNNGPLATGRWLPSYDNQMRPTGTLYTVSAGAGAPLYEQIDENCTKNAVGTPQFNYVIIEIEGPKLKYRAVDPKTDTVLDEFCVVKDPAALGRGLNCLN